MKKHFKKYNKIWKKNYFYATTIIKNTLQDIIKKNKLVLGGVTIISIFVNLKVIISILYKMICYKSEEYS